MKKQIAVLMAAATAVTTVAPVLASADVNDYNASTSEVISKITSALNERYKDKKADGIHASNANNVDAYLNSRYAVAVGIAKTNKQPLTDAEMDRYDVIDLTNSAYKNSAVATAFEGEKVLNSTDNYIYVIKDASKVQGLLENEVIGSNGTVKVAIVDKGYKDGEATETMTQKHYVVYDKNNTDKFDKDTQVYLSDLATALVKEKNKNISYVDTLDVYVNNVKEPKLAEAPDYYKGTAVTKVEVTLESGKKYTLEANDKAFDLEKPVDKDGKEIDLTNANQQSVLDTVEGFKYQDNKDDKEETVVLPLGDTSVYTVQDVMASTIELGKIYTNKEGYTKEGKDFVNGIIKARNYTNHNFEFNYNGVNYTLAKADGNKMVALKKKDLNGAKDLKAIREVTKAAVFPESDETFGPKIEKSGDGYVLRFNVRAQNTNSGLDPVILQFVIKGDSQKDLATVLKDLNGENSVVAGHFTRLEGANRYETAISVSADKFDPESADTVVIVGGEALMDGLSAVPLATAKNAPILLAHPQTGLDNATLNEISRACKGLNRKTVYVVGGEKSVPEKAVKQLEEKFGAVVLRVSGSDRFDTSLEVAKRLGYDGDIKFKSKNKDIKVEPNADLVKAEQEANEAYKKAEEVLNVKQNEYADAMEASENAKAKDKANSTPDTQKALKDAETKVSETKTAVDNALTAVNDAKKKLDEAAAEKEASTNSVKREFGDIYIVGGDGAADAMSISPVAARKVDGKVAPILVVPKNGLKRSTRDFISNFTGSRYLIGGETVLSSDVYRDIKSSKNAGVVSRISGSNRFDTNVQIIKRFYNDSDVNGAIFTSGDSKYLVDAQTAGPLAAEKSAPIVLTGAKLTTDQVNLLKNGGLLHNVKTNVYKVGGVVSADVMTVVVDKLGL